MSNLPHAPPGVQTDDRKDPGAREPTNAADPQEGRRDGSNYFTFCWYGDRRDMGGFEESVADPGVADMAAFNVMDLGLSPVAAVNVGLYVVATMSPREYAATARAMELELATREAEADTADQAPAMSPVVARMVEKHADDYLCEYIDHLTNTTLHGLSPRALVAVMEKIDRAAVAAVAEAKGGAS